MKFKVGDMVRVNTHKYDDANMKEFGIVGTVSRNGASVNVDFKMGAWEGQTSATWGSYDEEDLILYIPTKLEKAMK